MNSNEKLTVDGVIAKFCNPAFKEEGAPSRTFCTNLFHLANNEKIKKTIEFICNGYNYYLRQHKLTKNMDIDYSEEYKKFMRTANYINNQIKINNIDTYTNKLLNAKSTNEISILFSSANLLDIHKENWKQQ